MSREDEFFTMCTTLPFEEQKDDRAEDSIPELIKVAEYRDAGNMQAAVDYGKTLIKMFPDNDLPAFMVAYIYYQREYPDEAFQVAIESIPKCPRRYRLYSVAGLAEFDRGRLPEALVWWSRSVTAQCMVVDYQEHDPFLHLAHAALVVGMKQEAQALFTMSDAIEPSAPRIDANAQAKLQSLTNSWVKEPLKRVLAHLEKNYLRV
jgi:tetratricopeptide (TPR) repeat protein